MRTAYVPGEGLLTEHGHFFPEEDLRRFAQALADVVDAINALPPETRAALERAMEDNR